MLRPLQQPPARNSCRRHRNPSGRTIRSFSTVLSVERATSGIDTVALVAASLTPNGSDSHSIEPKGRQLSVPSIPAGSATSLTSHSPVRTRSRPSRAETSWKRAETDPRSKTERNVMATVGDRFVASCGCRRMGEMECHPTAMNESPCPPRVTRRFQQWRALSLQAGKLSRSPCPHGLSTRKQRKRHRLIRAQEEGLARRDEGLAVDLERIATGNMVLHRRLSCAALNPQCARSQAWSSPSPSGGNAINAQHQSPFCASGVRANCAGNGVASFSCQ